jgi:hypothetical protein
MFILLLSAKYFSPLVSQGFGLAIIGIAVGLLVLWQIATHIAIRFLWRGRPLPALLLLSLSGVLLGFPSLWLLLLGPAFLTIGTR